MFLGGDLFGFNLFGNLELPIPGHLYLLGHLRSIQLLFFKQVFYSISQLFSFWKFPNLNVWLLFDVPYVTQAFLILFLFFFLVWLGYFKIYFFQVQICFLLLNLLTIESWSSQLYLLFHSLNYSVPRFCLFLKNDICVFIKFLIQIINCFPDFFCIIYLCSSVSHNISLISLFWILFKEADRFPFL